MGNESESVLFINLTSKPFEWTWDKQWYKFESGERRWLPRFLANHFAKHLAIRELNDAKQLTDESNRVELMSKFIQEASAVSYADPLQAQVAILNKNNAQASSELKKFCDECDSKGVVHKKDCPKRVSKPLPVAPVVDEEFAGLNQ